MGSQQEGLLVPLPHSIEATIAQIGVLFPPTPLTQPSLRGEQSSPPDLPLAVGSKHRLTTCCGVKFAINHLDFKICVKVAVSNIIKPVK